MSACIIRTARCSGLSAFLFNTSTLLALQTSFQPCTIRNAWRKWPDKMRKQTITLWRVTTSTSVKSKRSFILTLCGSVELQNTRQLFFFIFQAIMMIFFHCSLYLAKSVVVLSYELYTFTSSWMLFPFPVFFQSISCCFPLLGCLPNNSTWNLLSFIFVTCPIHFSLRFFFISSTVLFLLQLLSYDYSSTCLFLSVPLFSWASPYLLPGRCFYS